MSWALKSRHFPDGLQLAASQIEESMASPHSPDSPDSPQSPLAESTLTRLLDDFLNVSDDGLRLPGIGDVVGGAYRILGELGRGAMGVVLEAFDLQLHRKVAIKFVNSASFDEEARHHFVREARAMALVNHPNVLAIHSFGEHASIPYFVMELVDGQTVETWLERSDGNAVLDEALSILNDVCLGVSAIHAAGTVHCDIKPSNVLLDEKLRVRVADLGLAAPYVDGAVTKVIAGTPEYMAPELAFDSDQPASTSSDIYALGCMAYEMLTGSVPFDGRSALSVMVRHATEEPVPPSRRRPGLPAAFDEVLLTALQKKPHDRYPSVDLFRRALKEARVSSVEPVRILVAEDDRDFRDLLALKLSMEFPDADIVCVENGGDLVTAYDQKAASVVMVDLQMPILDGVAVTALLRSRPDAQNVPIIVMTASGGPQDWKLLSALGADRFLVKPVNLDDVIATLRSAIRERASSPPAAPR